jgi:carbamoyl-phosphate synthase large subunit
MSFNVLVSSAGRRVALMSAFREDLQALGIEGRVFANDMSDLSAAWHSSDGSFIVPRCDAPNYVDFMLELCRKHQIHLLVPTIDPELPVLGAHRDAFASIGTTLHCSDLATLAIGGDKVSTHQWLTQSGLPTVRQATPQQVLSDPREWEWPLLVKPVFGSSSRGVRIVTNSEELTHATQGEPYLVQSIAVGEEYTVSCYVDRLGKTRCAVPRKRLETRGGEVSKGITFRHEGLQGLAARACESLPGAWGAMNIQIFLDSITQEMRIIELNPRFGGGFPLAWKAGAHYPRWLIEECLGLPLSAQENVWKDGLVMLRWDAAVFVDSGSLESPT